MNVSDPAVRLAAAAALVLLYAAMCAAIWLRERRRHRAQAAQAQALASAREGVQPLLVVYASQTGQAEELARETARLLHTAGEPVHLCALDQLDAGLLARSRRALFLASTYGEGDAPDNAAAFQQACMGAEEGDAGDLSQLQYGLLALGDRQYTHFCGFGRQLDAWLRARGAVQLFECVEMDNGDPAALTAWQHHLAQVSSLSELPAWEAPAFGPWTLAARSHLNPGSAGAPVHLLELVPPAGEAATWESGDLVQVCVPADLEHPREYSIASLASDGRVHLVVRQALRDDGTPGLASHWLTHGAPVGEAVQMRLRAHRNFRLEDNAARPLILVGNGTGIAGLRSHLRARAQAGAGQPNWLLFGERHAAHDFLFRDELLAWQAGGVITRLDLAFSRDDPSNKVYVQDLLQEHAAAVREWVEGRGAAIYVCGSLQGMAQGVDMALTGLLGPAPMAELVRSGRYRRDVY